VPGLIGWEKEYISIRDSPLDLPDRWHGRFYLWYVSWMRFFAKKAHPSNIYKNIKEQ